MRRLAELIGSDVPHFGFLPERPLERIRFADAEYAHAKLGWKAKTSLSDGLERTVDWYSRRLRQHAVS